MDCSCSERPVGFGRLAVERAPGVDRWSELVRRIGCGRDIRRRDLPAEGGLLLPR